MGLDGFSWRGKPFAAWLLRIAANMVADRFRHANRAIELSEVEDEGTSVQISLEEVERQAHLFRLVDQLPADQGRVIRLRFAEEKSIREIAHDLGRTEGAVKQLQFRALQTLRVHLEEKSGERNA